MRDFVVLVVRGREFNVDVTDLPMQLDRLRREGVPHEVRDPKAKTDSGRVDNTPVKDTPTPALPQRKKPGRPKKHK